MSLKNIFQRFKQYNQIFVFLRKYPIKIHNHCVYNHREYNSFTKNLPGNIRCSANYASDTIYSSDSDPEIETEDDLVELEEQSEFDSKVVDVRNILNANTSDPLIIKLNDCASVQEVFNIINKNASNLSVNHISQAILVLWDLQKCFYKHNLFYQSESNINKVLNTNSLLKNYVDQVNKHEDFKTLLKLVERNYQNFSLDALTCSLLYLNRMGIKISEDIMQGMIARCEKELIVNKNNFPLTALSRFAVTVYSQEDGILPIMVTRNALPIIISRLETCDNAEDFKLLTISLNKMHRLVTDELLEKYKAIAEKLLNEQKITAINHRSVLKVLMFLNRPQWHEYNFATIRKYVKVLKNSVNILSDRELIMLFKIFQMQKEPADMLEEIQNSASERLAQVEDSERNLEITLDLLSCVVSFSSPLQRPKFELLARRYVKNTLTPPSLSSLYKILYHIKSTDIGLCNSFWDKALDIIKEETDNKLNKLLGLCHKYIHFNNDVGHRYRYYKLEKQIIDLLLFELEFGLAGRIPYKFSRIASFIIAYNNNSEVLEFITNKINEMQLQFSSIDTLNLSKGLQIASENCQHKNTTHINKYFNTITSILDNCIRRETTKPTTLPNINMLLRGYVFRKGEVRNDLYKSMMKHFLIETNQFSSHILKDLSFNFQTNNCLVPEAIDKMADYVIEMGDSILGNTVDKLLYLCYYLGYAPKNGEDFFNTAAELIIRDKERLSGLAFLQTAIALCFFHKLPETLVKHIFSVNFLEKLDEELSHCYAKATYPVRVRDHMMQLNRSVCLDYPGSEVPWFHQKYVEELQKRELRKNYFHQKVFLTLLDTVKNQKSVSRNVFTPYGYYLDFEVNLEKEEELSNTTTSIL